MSTAPEILAEARRIKRTGDLRHAEQMAREVLEGEPANVEALHLVAVSLHASGKLAEAIPHYEEILRLDPGRAEVGNDLGTALAMQGRLDEAIAAFQRVLQHKPGHAAAQSNLGNALRLRGRTEEALDHLRQAVQHDPTSVDAHYNLGLALRKQGQIDQAIASLELALKLNPGYAPAFQELENIYQTALRAQPGFAEAYNRLGRLLTDNGRAAEAVVLLEQALRLQRDFVEAHNNLAWAHVHLARFEDAVASYKEALRLRPGDANYHNHLGVVLDAMGRTEEALAAFQIAFWYNPDHTGAHLHRGFALLRQGKFKEGWQEYEWRWRHQAAGLRARNDGPRWDGAPRPGQTLLVHPEQGVGDTIQFTRYLALARERVGTVLLECPPALMPLLSTCGSIDRLVASGDPFPPHDVQAPLLSLPGLLQPSRPLALDKPYLAADPQRVSAWRKELEGYPGRRVGIAWQGNPRHRWDRQRSFPLRHFLELSRLPGVQLFSLQKDHGAEQLADFEARQRVVDLGSRLDKDGGMSDVAAAIEVLDLVITCDSALAHLAGALGKPVWVALGANTDWRWMMDRTDSPWYPSMRLFRQRQRGDWDELFARVTQELGAADVLSECG